MSQQFSKQQIQIVKIFSHFKVWLKVKVLLSTNILLTRLPEEACTILQDPLLCATQILEKEDVLF